LTIILQALLSKPYEPLAALSFTQQLSTVAIIVFNGCSLKSPLMAIRETMGTKSI